MDSTCRLRRQDLYPGECSVHLTSTVGEVELIVDPRDRVLDHVLDHEASQARRRHAPVASAGDLATAVRPSGAFEHLDPTIVLNGTIAKKTSDSSTILMKTAYGVV